MPRRGRKPGKKQTGSIPVSAAPEMDIRTESLIQEAKDVQIPSSWAPITPVKPIPPIPHPICADRQKNQENWSAPEGFSTGLSQETQDHSTGEYCESTNSIHRNNRFHDWEEYLAKKSWVSGKGPICSELSIESDRLKNFPSANLRTHAAAARQGNVNGASSPGISNFNSQFQGNQFEGGSSTTAAFGNRDMSLGSNLRSNGSCASDTPLWRDMSLGSNLRSNGSCALDTLLYGDSIPYQPNYAPHSPPRAFTDAFLSRNITPQFAPITPDQSKKVDNKQAYDVHSLDVDERTNQAIHGNEVATARVDVEELHHDKEQQQLPKDGSSVVVSTQLDENHNPDKGGNLGIDLNITPQQKQRRRKHRPKVVKEGKPKRTPKPATPKPAGPKRKYVRKNPHNKTSGTPAAEVTSQSAEPKTAPHAAKSSRRKLDFELESKVSEESSSCRPQSNINVESQAQNFYARVESKSTVQLGEGTEVMVEKTNVGVAYDLTNALNKEFEDYLSMPERQPQSPILQTPTKNDLLHENLKAYVQNERTRGKCRIVFSDVTHDKQGSTVQTNSQSAPSPNNSNCSSFTSLDEGEQARGLKRGNPSTNDEARPRHTNLIGGHYNSSPSPQNGQDSSKPNTICKKSLNNVFSIKHAFNNISFTTFTASAMLVRSVINEVQAITKQVIPQQLHDKILSKMGGLMGNFSSQMILVIDETNGLYINEMFEASEIYLSLKISPSVERLKVSKAPGEKDLCVSINQREKIMDTFEGVQLTWQMICIETQKTSTDYEGGFETEIVARRSIELSFHKKYREMVLSSCHTYWRSQKQ